ncbi:uncharacterized protein [Typha latifolia]|uniref:uncharacterized protein n=1 Tax=Typha latifolia TaxID=4733 RepID=UPI003C2FBA26
MPVLLETHTNRPEAGASGKKTRARMAVVCRPRRKDDRERRRDAGVAALGPKGQAFARFVDESGLCDLGYEGIPYTWCNNQQGARRIWIRLDRALANTAWVSEHPECKVQHLDRGASDHAPLLLTVPAGMPRSKRPFRFELLWMEYEECLNEPDQLEPLGGGERGKTAKGHQPKLADLEELDANGLLSEEGTQSLRSCYNYKLALNRQLNIKWLQRSRLKWTEEGDRNTKFFHLSATMRRRRNSIVGIQGNDGSWFQESEAVSRCFTDFYHRLQGEADEVDPGSRCGQPFLPSRQRKRHSCKDR